MPADFTDAVVLYARCADNLVSVRVDENGQIMIIIGLAPGAV